MTDPMNPNPTPGAPGIMVFDTVEKTDNEPYLFVPNIDDNLLRAERFDAFRKQGLLSEGDLETQFAEYYEATENMLPLVVEISPMSDKDMQNIAVARLLKQNKHQRRAGALTASEVNAARSDLLTGHAGKIYNLAIRNGKGDVQSIRHVKDLVAALAGLSGGVAHKLAEEITQAVSEFNRESPGFLLDARWQGSF